MDTLAAHVCELEKGEGKGYIQLDICLTDDDESEPEEKVVYCRFEFTSSEPHWKCRLERDQMMNLVEFMREHPTIEWRDVPKTCVAMGDLLDKTPLTDRERIARVEQYVFGVELTMADAEKALKNVLETMDIKPLAPLAQIDECQNLLNRIQRKRKRSSSAEC